MVQISVIIPTFNRASLLARAIHSVMEQQGVTDFDLWIIDDGSTDETAQLVAKLQHYYGGLRPEIAILYRYQRQQGVSVARNNGIAWSAGPYLAFLDSDDQWLPGKLQAQMEFFQQYPHLEIAQTEEIWVRYGQRVNPCLKHRKSGGQLFARSLNLCLISPSAVMMTRRLLERFGGFDARMIVCEDYDLWLKITSHYLEVGLLPQPLVVKYGGHDDQLSRKMPAMDYYRVVSMYQIWLEQQATPRLNFADEAALVQCLQQKCRILLQGMKKHGNYLHYPEVSTIFQTMNEKVLLSREVIK